MPKQPETSFATPACAGLILSGGLGTRMGGKNKALVELAGRSLLQHVIDALSPLFPELLLATREPSVYAPWRGALRIVEDIFETRSPLAGIHSGLNHTAAEYVFCVACDTPLVQRGLVERLLAEIAPGIDVIVPADGTHRQPLCAIYGKSCIPLIERQLWAGDQKIDRFFSYASVKPIPYEAFREADPELVSFFNVNDQGDLAIAEKLLREERATDRC
jgi:molybdenum cofactor guanylyltransferase